MGISEQEIIRNDRIYQLRCKYGSLFVERDVAYRRGQADLVSDLDVQLDDLAEGAYIKYGVFISRMRPGGSRATLLAQHNLASLQVGVLEMQIEAAKDDLAEAENRVAIHGDQRSRFAAGEARARILDLGVARDEAAQKQQVLFACVVAKGDHV